VAIEKHTTEGLVLEAYDQGEHDKAFKVAAAQGQAACIAGRLTCMIASV
jgi:hypothetical protein